MKRNYYMVGIVFLTFFVISFITNILGALIPDIQHSFDVSYSMVAFLPFSFFIAYAFSIPAGIFIEAYGEKKAMVISFLVAFAGAALISLFASYAISLLSLFLIGIGMAMLQVVINPLLRISGGEEHFAFNSVMAQLLFGLASYLSPHVYTYVEEGLRRPEGVGGNFFLSLLKKITNPQYTWTSLYWIFLVLILAMIVVVLISRFPKVVLKEEEKAGTLEVHLHLIRQPVVILFFLGIFSYVGTEQGVSVWMSEFLHQYHGKDTLTDGANAVSYYWGLMTVGCVLNLLLLKLFDSRKLLIAFTLLTMIVLAVALFGPAKYAMIAFPAIGFTISCLFSVVFSLALNSLAEHHGSFSGILCTGIIGGAAVPLLIGWLADHIGLKAGMCFIYIFLAYILGIGFWAKPLINNKTIG